MTSVVGDSTLPRALVRVERDGEFARVTMDVPERRNALSLEHMHQLLAAVRAIGSSDARGVLLAANGPVFCAGHDFGDMVEADLAAMRELLALCTELMRGRRGANPRAGGPSARRRRRRVLRPVLGEAYWWRLLAS